MHRIRTTLLLATAALATPALLLAEDETVPPPPRITLDFAFYKERVSPIVHGICAECHSDPRDKHGRHFIRPTKGRPVRERDHERNFEMLKSLIEPGNPAGSIWLLKPLGPRQGGVPHKGGERIRYDSLEYGVMVDFINGAKYVPPVFRPPPTEPGQPDFRYFFAHVEPTLQAVCSECHSERQRGRFKPLLVARDGNELTLEDHYANFQTVLALLEVGRPQRSRFLQKPLAQADGGLEHKGGDRIFAGDDNYVAWVDFIRGTVGPPLPDETPEGPPEVTRDGLTLQAEKLTLEGDVAPTTDGDAQDRKVVVPGERGGAVIGGFRLPAESVWQITFRLRGPGAPPRLSLDRRAAGELSPPAQGFGDVGPSILLDGEAPLLDVTGTVVAAGTGVRMEGRNDAVARWLSPAEVDHSAIELELKLPDESQGGDDAWLLFDMADGWNGKFLGLADGGRRVVMGLLEGGRPRVLSTADAPPADSPHHTLRVEYVEGVAVGRLDGKPRVFLHLDRQLGQGLFGVATHGPLEVDDLRVYDDWQVHKVAIRAAPALRLGAGDHVLRVELPPGAAGLDSLTIREFGR